MKKMLIVEDDESLSRGMVFTFQKSDFIVMSATSVLEAKETFNRRESKIDIIVLDLGLPDGNGMDFCKYVREKSNVPIIMLTACDLETDEVAGLMAGADDYITKPFSLSVLRARVETALRRSDNKNSNIIDSAGFTLKTDLCKLYKGELEIQISTTEFRLLKYLMVNEGQILTKEQILSALWDNQGNFVDENTLPVNISRIRAKIEKDPKNPSVLKTIHGIGYVWVKDK